MNLTVAGELDFLSPCRRGQERSITDVELSQDSHWQANLYINRYISLSGKYNKTYAYKLETLPPGSQEKLAFATSTVGTIQLAVRAIAIFDELALQECSLLRLNAPLQLSFRAGGACNVLTVDHTISKSPNLCLKSSMDFDPKGAFECSRRL